LNVKATHAFNIIRGLSTSYFRFAIFVLGNFLLTPVILEYTGQDGYGLWATIRSVMAYLLLLDFGLTPAITKFVAEYSAQEDQKALSGFVSTALSTYLVLAAFVLGIGVISSGPITHFLNFPRELVTEGRVVLLVTSLTVAIRFPGTVLSGLIYGHQRLAVLNATKIAETVGWVGFSILALHLGFGLIGLALAQLLSQLLMTAIQLGFVRLTFPRISFNLQSFSLDIFRKTFSYSAYQFITIIGHTIIFSSDNLVISRYLSTAAVASYAVAFRLNRQVLQIIYEVGGVFFPTFSALRAVEDGNRLQRALLVCGKISAGLAIFSFITMVFFGPSIITLWVGAENYVGTTTLILLAGVVLMSSFINTGATLLQGIGEMREMSISYSVEALLSVVLSILLVHRFGVVGVALGTFLAQAATNLWFILWRATRQAGLSISIYLKSAIWPPLYVSVPSVICAFLLRSLASPTNWFGLGIEILAVLLCYAISYWVFAIAPVERTLYFERVRQALLGSALKDTQTGIDT